MQRKELRRLVKEALGDRRVPLTPKQLDAQKAELARVGLPTKGAKKIKRHKGEPVAQLNVIEDEDEDKDNAAQACEQTFSGDRENFARNQRQNVRRFGAEALPTNNTERVRAGDQERAKVDQKTAVKRHGVTAFASAGNRAGAQTRSNIDATKASRRAGTNPAPRRARTQVNASITLQSDYKQQLRNAVLNYLNEVNARDGKRNTSKPMNRPTYRGTTNWDTGKTTPLKPTSPLWKKGAMKKHNADMDAVEAKRSVRAGKKKVRDFAEKNARRYEPPKT